ncbi:uncharacterized protein Dwil_GK15567 [Drosophila willistoni]|uniref:Uncharacterized protein n=1 Tax=Drosophila willistoni TaxID=7260 RepID=B4MX01_DROWI|nr:uncharacterized protein LOC6642396 [Drosophila willistoni]EDW76640.1 uncharacterized protein Dwil_GK15567 [Drosophila willistoni]
MATKPTTSLLPYVIDLLSRKKSLCTNVNSLCDEIKDAVIQDHIRNFDSLKDAVEFAIGVGMELGILAKSKGGYRLPFTFNTMGSKPMVDRITAAQGRAAIRRRMPAKNKLNLGKTVKKVQVKRPKLAVGRARRNRPVKRTPTTAAKK